MQQEGPPLERLTRRLAECPADFLAEPRIGRAGVVHVAAVVADLLRDLGGEPLPGSLRVFEAGGRNDPEQNRLRTVLVASWLLHDSWFRARLDADRACRFLAEDVAELAPLVGAPKLVTDPDRREELSRLCLKAFGLRPAGETEAQAQDRLTTISSLERLRVVRESRAAEERMRQIRAAMRRQAAEEAAAKLRRE